MTVSRIRFRAGIAALLGVGGTLALSGLAVTRTSARPQPAQQAASADTGHIATPLTVSWRYTGVPFANNPAGVVVSGDTAYFASGNRVYAVALSDGALRWKYPADAALATLVTTTPAVDDDTLYVGAGDGVYALNTSDGKVKWHFFLKSSVSTSPRLRGHYIYFTADDGRFYEVDTRSGSGSTGLFHRGNTPGVEIGSEMTADFVISNDTAFYVTSDDILHAVNLGAGNQKWFSRLDGQAEFSPVVSGELVYLASGNTLGAYRVSTGQRRWSIPLPASAAAAPATDADGNIYIVSADRYVYALDSRSRPIWKQYPRLDFEVAAQPVVAGDLLLIGTAEGGVYAIDRATGALRWNTVIHPSAENPDAMPTKANVMSAPVVSHDSIYVLTDDGSLSAFRNSAVDNTPPTVHLIEPGEGAYVNGRPPFYISAKIYDEGSGVNLDTLRITLDNQLLPRRPGGMDAIDQVGYFYNPDNDTVDFQTAEGEAGHSNALPDGHHTLTISVADWKGNRTTKVTSFYTDDALPHERHNAGARNGRGGFGGGRNGGPPGGGGAPGGKGNG